MCGLDTQNRANINNQKMIEFATLYLLYDIKFNLSIKKGQKR